MYEITVTIKEVLTKEITKKIDAKSLEEAKAQLLAEVRKLYDDEKIILDADDFSDVNIEIL